MKKIKKYQQEEFLNTRALGIAGEGSVEVRSKVRVEALTDTAKYRCPTF